MATTYILNNIIRKFDIDQRNAEDLVRFYKDHFNNDSDLYKFICTAYAEYKQNENNTYIKLIQNTMRLVKLADDMEKIRPGRDALKIAYFVTCVETLNKLVGNKFQSKVLILVDFFKNHVSEQDQDLILQKVRRNYADTSFKLGEVFQERISMEIFARIINEARNVFLHEGGYWKILFSNDGTSYLRIINVEEQWVKGTNVKPERVYDFELAYEEFRNICIRGFINFIIKYMNNAR